MIWKTDMRLCGVLAATLLLLLLTGCSQISAEKRRIWQPSTLKPIDGQTIQTTEGYYVTGPDEVWHSDIRFRDLEQAYLNSAVK